MKTSNSVGRDTTAKTSFSLRFTTIVVSKFSLFGKSKRNKVSILYRVELCEVSTAYLPLVPSAELMTFATSTGVALPV